MWRDRGAGLPHPPPPPLDPPSAPPPPFALLTADLKIVLLAVLFLAIGIGVYLLMTGLIVWRSIHDPAAPELVQPDMWILMGGAAIATLAGDHIHKAGLESVRPVTVVTWLVATAWIAPLITSPCNASEGDAGFRRGCGGRRCSHLGCTPRPRMPRPSKPAGGG